MTKSNDRNNSSQHNSSSGNPGDWAKTYYSQHDRFSLALSSDQMQALEDLVGFLGHCDHELLGFHSLEFSAVIGELARTGCVILSTDPDYDPGPPRDIGVSFDFVPFIFGGGGTILVLEPRDMECLERFASLVRHAPDAVFPVPDDCSWGYLVGWIATECHSAMILSKFESSRLIAREGGEERERKSNRHQG